ncbi:MAG: hypothetical protein RL630_625 [Verrucomicrobiota bacterium]|jgi:hypothetical protein
MMQANWEIKSRAHQCSRTGREFAEGEFFYTILVREGEGFLREDMSEEAWNERNENIQPFSFWRSKYEPPAPPPAEPLPRDDAEGLLRRLIQENDPAYSNVRYILALMLERKRVIRPLESSDDDMLVYEHLATGETFVLANPKLSLERIPEVQREVSALLDPAA